MAKPQQPELRRSEQIPALSPDAIVSELEANHPDGLEKPTGDEEFFRRPSTSDGAANEDKPNLDDVADQLGTNPPS